MLVASRHNDDRCYVLAFRDVSATRMGQTLDAWSSGVHVGSMWGPCGTHFLPA